MSGEQEGGGGLTPYRGIAKANQLQILERSLQFIGNILTEIHLLIESVSEIIAKTNSELDTAICEFKLKPLAKVCELLKK